ncbi:histidine phosphatase superfamily-domain-containing protein [Catenaria anguillulae PL171]|uniref:Inositol hexakisphosphate and diphosphoinositol-pentakisphosphate kinase n=1 Tax=Catenaria anguillulae PL171 TaxID=765915 RepID=A0A1Y2HHK2_9FUNG|nr:histidine phosphatase superfamily-domain-containing protein [Catenaria anguillulae PL171]
MPSPPQSPARRQIPTRDGKFVIGVCAMDAKARSKPMRNILNRLVATGHFEVQIFGDKQILSEKIEDWPACNFLISFFSTGFPLDKAIEYVKLRRPYLVNDLVTQKALFDRRLVLAILDHIGVPTPRRVLVNRDLGDGGKEEIDLFSEELVSKIERHLNLYIPNVVAPTKSVEQVDYDTLVVDGVTITKPFVEKPVSGEDHNIYIYFHSSQGGGCRKLFRKIANKSSEFVPDLWQIRNDNNSYIYEEYHEQEQQFDVKVYTLGPIHQHAETRKSPVVDGIVQRNHDGKEIRYITQLSPEEKEYARRVCLAFGQTICGFDLLRVGGKSYVIDVNGWSFVKGNDGYYDQCAAILSRLFRNAAKRHRGSLMLTKDASFENQWKLKGFFGVIRHGDRTPKLKKKFSFMSSPFVELLGGGKEEVIFKREETKRVAEAAERALELGLEKEDQLRLVLDILRAKEDNEDVKVQVKPSWKKGSDGAVLDKLQVICKWGGRFTHAGRHQSLDLGENLRKDLMLLNKELLEDVKVYSASETRVVQTAEAFMETFLDQPAGSISISSPLPPPPPSSSTSSLANPAPTSNGTKVTMEIRRDMLDDSNAAKEEMERVKKSLKATPENLVLPGIDHLDAFVGELMNDMRQMRACMHANFAKLDVSAIQSEWCCDESPALFRERWEKLFKEFCDGGDLDLSKVSDLYDMLKGDVLHNKNFVSRIFVDEPEFEVPRPPPTPGGGAARTGTPPNVTGQQASNASPLPSAGSSPLVGLGLSVAAGNNNSSNNGNPAATMLTAAIDSIANTPCTPSAMTPPKMVYPAILRELYRKAKVLFDYVGPAEYGSTSDDKKLIGLLTSSSLLHQILDDLEETRRRPTGAATRLYFTKESHVHTLLNLVYVSGIPTKIPQAQLDELDYLTQITFELYERGRGIGSETEKEFSVRISFSPGGYCAELVELKVDERHAISTAGRRDLTDHVSLDEVMVALSKLIAEGSANDADGKVSPSAGMSEDSSAMSM